MTNIIPLQIHPWPPSDEQMAMVREAKASLNLDLKVLPTEAVPGLHGRVLALGSLPPWLCDAALVKEPLSEGSVTRALDWLLTAPEGDDRGFMVKDYLEAIFGHEVEELPPPRCRCEELGCDGEVAVDNYKVLNGRCRPCYAAGCYLTKGLCLRD